MNFLDLCKAARREMAIPGTGPVDTTTQTGELQRVVEWVNEAWMEIQRMNNTQWRWMRATMPLKDISSGTKEYNPVTDFSLTDFGWWYIHEFSIYLTSAGDTDERPLYYLPWENYRYLYVIRKQQDSYPYYISIKPDYSIALGPGPNASFKLRGEYQKKATLLSGDSDIPEMPDQYHMAIVWKALMLYGTYEAAPDAYSRGKIQFERILSDMEMNQLPMIDTGMPLV